MHSQPVYNTALRILRNESDAAEVMQDTLLKYLSGGVRSSNPAQAAAWLRTTCIRKAIDLLRSHKKDPVFVDADSLDVEASGASVCRYKALNGAPLKTKFDVSRGSKLISM